MIEPGRDRPGDRTLRTEVCVIGSGAGGAVVAAELAEGGRDVVVLEQGGYNTAADFDQREDSMLPMLFEEGGMRAPADGATSLLPGRRGGGSTVHNLCHGVRAPDPILELWREEHGVRDLDQMWASFDRVEKWLHVQPIS